MPSHFLPPRVAARWFTGKHPESDWPSIARDALEAGLDGSALRRLASYEQTLHWDVAKYSEPALSEMGASKMSQREALLWSVKDVCRDILEGARDPFEIWRDKLRRQCYPEELMPIFNEIEMQGTGLLSGSEQEALQIILSHARDSVSPDRRQTACAQSESSVHFFQNAGLRFQCHHRRAQRRPRGGLAPWFPGILVWLAPPNRAAGDRGTPSRRPRPTRLHSQQ